MATIINDYMKSMSRQKFGLLDIYPEERIYLLEEYHDSVYPESGKLCTIHNIHAVHFEDFPDTLCALDVWIVYDGLVGIYGTYMDYIILDYTKYLIKRNSANRIKRAWKRYLQRKYSVHVIQRCYLNWQFRKSVLWNPRTILGISNLYLEYLKMV
jgi:hypothetical protein